MLASFACEPLGFLRSKNLVYGIGLIVFTLTGLSTFDKAGTAFIALILYLLSFGLVFHILILSWYLAAGSKSMSPKLSFSRSGLTLESATPSIDMAGLELTSRSQGLSLSSTMMSKPISSKQFS